MVNDPGHIDYPYGVTAIDTHYVRPLCDASHLIVHNGRAAFVDTGTAFSVPGLLKVLEIKDIDPDQVDYVLLTHVHLDHAGGAGQLMQALPNAQAVLHPRGAPHMIDPSRLVAGTIAVYGEEKYHELYDELIPIDEHRVLVVEDGDMLCIGERPLEFIHTPGHARHHYCIIDPEARGIFSGDTFGVSYREFDTDNGAFIFPTTTPVHFDPDAAHASIDRLMSYKPESIYVTHYSRLTELDRLSNDMHECLDAFEAMAKQHVASDDRTSAIRRDMYEFLDQRLVAHGYAGDADRRRQWLEMDVALNTAGIEVWLDRTSQQDRAQQQ